MQGVELRHPRRWPVQPRSLRVLLLCLACVLPSVMVMGAQNQGAAQQVGQDTLWVGHLHQIGVCESPSSSTALANCFSSMIESEPGITAIGIDGANVFFGTTESGAMSCPIEDLGQNCTQIMAGPWPNSTSVDSMAVSDGQLWIGQVDGKIYHCPSNLPFVDQNTAPDSCVLLGDEGGHQVTSLLYANNRLYAGLENHIFPGKIVSCAPQTADSCESFDEYGSTRANALVAGGGYLWAGLKNGIIWRCDLNAADHCDNWDTAGDAIRSLSYDGQGTIYASVAGSNGVVWACPVDRANSCSVVRGNVNAYQVTAGDGGVFASTSADLAFNSQVFTGAVSSGVLDSYVLYVPAEGVTSVGEIALSIQIKEWSQRIGRHCDGSGEGKKTGRVTIRGPHMRKTVTIDLCDLRAGGRLTHTFSMLDHGDYKVSVRARGFHEQARVTVDSDETVPIKVQLSPKS